MTARALLLPAPAGVDPRQLGGKGAALDRLAGIGVPIPPCAVVIGDAYREFASDPALVRFLDELRRRAVAHESAGEIAEIDRAFLDAPLRPGLAGELTDIATAVAGPSSLVVRSSATAEDTKTASFAGQYRSYLHVRGAAAVERAVRLTWASLWYPSPRAYRRHFQIDEHDLAMAVILMRQIDATESGVVFTVDPTDAAQNAIRVEYVAGLADQLVSGQVTPSVLHLARDGVGAGPLAYASELRRAALAIEQSFGVPMDIEFAYDGDALYIVQARPQTTSHIIDPATADFDVAPPPGTRTTTGGIAEMLPGTLPVLLWEINSFLVEEALRQLLDALGSLPDQAVGAHEFAFRVDGRALLNLDAMQAASLSVADHEDSYDAAYTARPIRARRRGFVPRLVHDLRIARVRRQARFESAVIAAAAETLTAAETPLPADDDALASLAYRLIDLGSRAMAAEALTAACAAASFERLLRRLQRYLKHDDALTLAQSLTTDHITTDSSALTPERRRRACAALFAGPSWLELGLEPGHPVGISHTSGIEMGLRSAQSSKRWRRERLFGGPFVNLPQTLLDHSSRDAAALLRARERSKSCLFAIGGELRRALLEIGARLVARERADTATDVEHLRVGELRAALRAQGPTAAELRRRRQHHEALSARRPTATAPRGDVSQLHGWGASAGHYRGRARVVMSPQGAIDTGEVLVTRTTDASWTPLFLRAGALVLEEGGPLSHAAIVARELGLPAVTNVPGIVELIMAHDGNPIDIDVDGDRGDVSVHPCAQSATR